MLGLPAMAGRSSLTARRCSMFKQIRNITQFNTPATAISRIRPVYATMAITQNEANTVTVAAAVDDTLPPPVGAVPVGPGPFDGYVKVSGYTLERAKEIVVSGDEMTMPNDGVYVANVGWATFRHSQNSATVGFAFAFERGGELFFTQRPTTGRVPNIGDPGNVAGGGSFDAIEGDKLSVWVASDKAGTVTIPNSNVTVQMVEDTSA